VTVRERVKFSFLNFTFTPHRVHSTVHSIHGTLMTGLNTDLYHTVDSV
jgi:hypothetical protein